MIKAKNKFTKEVVYYRFLADQKEFPNNFWYTKNKENTGFEMGNMDYYTPLKTTWSEIIKNEKI